MKMKSLFLGLILIILVAAQTGNSYLDSTRTSGRVIFLTNGGSFDSVPSELCAPDDNTDCRPANYTESIMLIGFIPFFIGFIICCACPWFWLCRICWCGGYKASEGCCIPGPRKIYQQSEIWTCRILAIAFAILSLIFFIIAIVGNSLISDAQNQAVGGFVDTVIDVQSDVQFVRDQYVAFDVDQRRGTNILATIDDALSIIQQVVDGAEMAEDISSQASDAREAVGVVALVFALIPAIVLGCAGCWKSHWLAWCPALTMWFTLWLLWLSFGLHYPFSALTGDVCVSVNNALFQNQTSEATELLLECQGSEVQSVVDQNQMLVDDLTFEGCNALQMACNGTAQDLTPGFDFTMLNITNPALAMCPSDFSLSACISDPEIFNGYVNETLVLDTVLGCPTGIMPVTFGSGCPYDEIANGPCMSMFSNDTEIICEEPAQYIPVRDCATSCREPTSQFAADQLVFAADAALAFNILGNEILRPLGQCQPIFEFWATQDDAVCGTMGDGLAAVVVGVGAQAILGIFGLAVAIMATKRFNSENSDETDLDEVDME